MKVYELIAKLLKMPAGAVVYIQASNAGIVEALRVHKDADGDVRIVDEEQ